MGIPYYFKKVSSKFPTALSPKLKGCSRLFLDFNCAIHYCSNELKQSAEQIDTLAAFEARLIAEVLKYIDFLVAEAKPSELMYISMDGLAPRAKMAQQRSRRYIGAYVKDKLAADSNASNASPGKAWDSNAISPGTVFMASLATAICAHCTKYTFEAILSDTTEIGEGEHKITGYIHAHPTDAQDVIYGLDADLIMLALINQNAVGIKLMREPTFYDSDTLGSTKNTPFIYLDVGLLGTMIRTHIASSYGIVDSNGNANGNANGTDAIAVYVFLCFFIGNDFVPNLSFIKLKEDGLETLMACYKTTVEETGEHVLKTSTSADGQRRHSINFRVLWKLLERVARLEDDAFLQIHDKYMNQTVPKCQGKSQPSGERQLQAWPSTQAGRNGSHADRIRPSEKGWRLNYYHYLFASMTDVISDACKSYLQGLQWLVDCYFHHSPHRGWYYRHAYSPTILDMFNYMTSELSKLNAPALRGGFDVDGPGGVIGADELDLQLMCILPSASAHLVKPHLRPLFTDVNHGLVHMFPQAFGFDGYLKRFLWECHPRIPVPSVGDIRDRVEAVAPSGR